MRMRAALFYEHGGPEMLRIEEIDVPKPGPGEVRVRVRAVALNHLDLWVRRGLPIDIELPHIGGSDIAGEIDDVGSGVHRVQPGERAVVNPSLWCGECEWCLRGEQSQCVNYRIIGEHVRGGAAEFVVVPARNVYPISDGVSFERAAAAPLVFMTAWRALITQGALKPGDTVLVTGASGGVSTAAIQIARFAGARVMALTSAPHMDRVRELGAHVVYDRADGEWTRALWRETGKRGVDVVLDSVGTAIFGQCVRSLARGGRMVTYGATTGPTAELDLRVVFWKQVSIVGSTMANQEEFQRVMDLVFAGEFDPVVDSVRPLAEIREAHARLESGEAFGNIVLVP
ncbi:MAG TPA: zinc-binding dehydrogenase [Longimicrobiales bacterium]|nr:zinc-binding dehydrogenase [Longimicrobiales bacterium]